MIQVAEQLEQAWQTRLSQDEVRLSPTARTSVVCWLLGEDRARFERLPPEQLAVVEQGMDYRYRLLLQRYLNASPTQAYRNLIERLGSLVVLRNKIRTWVSLSRDRQRAVTDVLQEVIQEMLNSDRYIQSQIAWIAQCTKDETLRNNLLLASIEEYCLRPIRNQPLLVYRFVNYLRRSQRGGMTQVPQQQSIRLISEEITVDESEGSVSLLDTQAILEYQAFQQWEEQQTLRQRVQQEFEAYLLEKVGSDALEWLKLYLQGRSQEAIASQMNLPVKEIYRLREKVGYHAIQVFTFKSNPDLVEEWLGNSPIENNFGLTPQLWQAFWHSLSGTEREIIQLKKAGQSMEEIAQSLNLKKTQALNLWRKVYLKAQELRNQS